MNILLATSFPFPGTTGSPIHTMQVARGLADRGHDVVVVKYAGREGSPSTSSWEGIPVRHVPRRRWVPAMVELIRSYRPDVCYAHGDVAMITAFPITRLLRVPMVHEVHSLPADPGDPLSRGAAAREVLARRIAPHLDHQIVLSQRVASELEGRQAVARTGYTVCYPPVDLAAFRADARAPRAGSPVIVYAGNLFPYQGVDLLVTAASRVWEQRPDARFRFVGGTREATLHAFPGMPRIDDERMEFLDRQPLEAMPPLLHDADVLVIPRPDVAENRTTSRKLGEYLATGRVVVATDVADHEVIFRRHRCGIVVEPSVAGIADGILDAVSGSEASAGLPTRAVAAAEELFSLERGVAAREAILVGVAGTRRRRRTIRI